MVYFFLEADWLCPDCDEPAPKRPGQSAPAPARAASATTTGPATSAAVPDHHRPPASEAVPSKPLAVHTVCTLLKLNCAPCKRRVRHLNESRTHSMQWPGDVLALVWDKVRETIRPGLKARLWAEVHKELLLLDFSFDDDSDADLPEDPSMYDPPPAPHWAHDVGYFPSHA